MAKTITFSTNWNNKLNCDNYTTLRLSGQHNVGDLLEVWHKGAFIHHAKVVDKKRLYMDTGYNREECCKILRRMYPKIDDVQWQNQPIYFYLFAVEKLPVTA